MRLITVPLLLLCLSSLACSESTGPSTDVVAGSYEAAVFTTTADGHEINQLAAGASISLYLMEDRSTAGRLFIPGAAEDSTDVDMDLAGTWSLDSNVVTLDHAADTFLRDMPLTFARDTTVRLGDWPGPFAVIYFSGSRLEGEASFSGVTVIVSLRKSL